MEETLRKMLASVISSFKVLQHGNEQDTPITGNMCLHASKKDLLRISPCSDFTCSSSFSAGAKTVPSIFELCCT